MKCYPYLHFKVKKDVFSQIEYYNLALCDSPEDILVFSDEHVFVDTSSLYNDLEQSFIALWAEFGKFDPCITLTIKYIESLYRSSYIGDHFETISLKDVLKELFLERVCKSSELEYLPKWYFN